MIETFEQFNGDFQKPKQLAEASVQKAPHKNTNPVPHLLSSVLPPCSGKKLPMKNKMYSLAALLLKFGIEMAVSDIAKHQHSRSCGTFTLH